MELAGKNSKTVLIIILHMFRKIEENMHDLEEKLKILKKEELRNI